MKMKNQAKFLWLLSAVLLMALAALSGCGGGNPAAGGGGGGGPAPIPSYYVNATIGSDVSGTGSQASPFQSITKALRVASAAAVATNIYVAPGTYSDASAAAGNKLEIFPIKMANNVSLIGDVANKGNGATPTAITGSATYTVTGGSFAGASVATVVFPPGVRASISGFQINTGTNGLIADGAVAAIVSNTITDNGLSNINVIVANGSSAILTSNNISSAYIGVATGDASTSAMLRGNAIVTTGAGSALLYGPVVTGGNTGGTADNLDMGTAASPGNNTITGGTANVGLYVRSTTNVLAVGNTWKANIQGADASGHYPASFVPASAAAVAGNNYGNPAGSAGIQFYGTGTPLAR